MADIFQAGRRRRKRENTFVSSPEVVATALAVSNNSGNLSESNSTAVGVAFDVNLADSSKSSKSPDSDSNDSKSNATVEVNFSMQVGQPSSSLSPSTSLVAGGASPDLAGPTRTGRRNLFDNHDQDVNTH